MRRIVLRAGALEVQVAPQVGGSIARFDRVNDRERVPLFRGCDAEAANAGDVLAAGCFPLVPYANRIRGGTFVCDGHAVHLAPNMPGDASPLHGQGWRGAWQVVAATADAAELSFEHPAGEWPWHYAARQRIALDAHGLDIALACRNLSPAPMPCGLGLHPYFPCDADTELDTAVGHAWTIDAHVLPVACVPAEGRYGLRHRRICGQDLDNGFDGWDGSATIRWQARGIALRMTSRDAGRFQVWSPAGGGVFVAEPVQNANAALNLPQADWAAAGVRMLSQGDEAVLRARLAVTADAAPAAT